MEIARKVGLDPRDISEATSVILLYVEGVSLIQSFWHAWLSVGSFLLKGYTWYPHEALIMPVYRIELVDGKVLAFLASISITFS